MSWYHRAAEGGPRRQTGCPGDPPPLVPSPQLAYRRPWPPRMITGTACGGVK